MQQAGDLLWFPPGWHHEVFTSGGTQLTGLDVAVAPHWVAWCIPKRMVTSPLAMMGCGLAIESQCPNQITMARKKKLYGAMMGYAAMPGNTPSSTRGPMPNAPPSPSQPPPWGQAVAMSAPMEGIVMPAAPDGTAEHSVVPVAQARLLPSLPGLPQVQGPPDQPSTSTDGIDQRAGRIEVQGPSAQPSASTAGIDQPNTHGVWHADV